VGARVTAPSDVSASGRPPGAFQGDVPDVSFPVVARITTPESSIPLSETSESTGLLRYFSHALRPSSRTPGRTADRPETTTTFSAHPSMASAGRVAPHSMTTPAPYRAGSPSPSLTTLSRPSYADYGYAQPPGVPASPVGTSAWSARPPIGESAVVGQFYDASHGMPPRPMQLPAGPPLGATHALQSAAPSSASYHPTLLSACPNVWASPVNPTTWFASPPLGATHVPPIVVPVDASYYESQLSAYPPTDGSRYPSAYPGGSQPFLTMDHTSTNVRPSETSLDPVTESSEQARGTPFPHVFAANLPGPSPKPPARSVSFVDPRATEVRPPPDEAGRSSARTPRSLVKLAPYDGTGSLETFLAKFHNIARYLMWTEADKFFHLCASLEGSAGQVLWDAGPQPTTESVIRLFADKVWQRITG